MTTQDNITNASLKYAAIWHKWIATHPDHDETAVYEAMQRGELPPKEISPRGRPASLDDETHQIIIDAIAQGAYYEDAANAAGVTYRTLNNWRNRGEVESERRSNDRIKAGTKLWEREEIYFHFFHALKKAEGQAVVKNLQFIDSAAKDGNWQAAAWRLERRYPERYGRKHHTASIQSWKDDVVKALIAGEIKPEDVRIDTVQN